MEADAGLIKREWKLARVIETVPSKDGLVRSVTIKDGQGREYERPVNRLCPLDFQQ